jgi:hypothetical protein
LVLMAGVSVGLAVTRIPQVRWFDGVLAAFVAWFAIGCWTRAIATLRTASQCETADQRIVLWLYALAKIVAPSAVGLGAGLLLAREAGVEELRILDLSHSQALRFLCLGLVMVTVITTVEPPSVSKTRSPVWQAITNAAGAIAGVGLALALIGDMMLIPMLVHLAISGVRGANRYFPAGDEFSPEAYDPSSLSTFAFQGIAAFAAWIVAALLLRALVNAAWGSRRCWILGVTLVAAILVIASLLAAGMRLADRQVSPVMADFILHEKPVILWWLAVPFLATAACYASNRLLGVRSPNAAELRDVKERTPMRPWDQWLIVLFVPLVWWISDQWDSIRDVVELILKSLGGMARDEFLAMLFLSDVTLFLSDITTMLMLAYLLVWLQIAWRRWKGYDDHAGQWEQISPSRLVVVWQASLALLATAAPVWGWLIFVLWTWPGQFPGEAWLLLQK